MSKLDRSILIFIGLGIWTLALNYVFELTSSRAAIDSNCKDDQNPCFVSLVTLYKKDDGSVWCDFGFILQNISRSFWDHAIALQADSTSILPCPLMLSPGPRRGELRR